jgi:TBC1 domain family member 2B
MSTGMNFLAGMLLLYMPEESAFWTLVDIVEKYLTDYFLESMLGVVVDQLVCRELLQQKFPLVTAHAEELQVDLALVSTQWCDPAELIDVIRLS